LFCSCKSWNLSISDLSKKLRNYELLQHTDIVSESDGRAKRSLPPHLADKPEAIKQLTIKTPSKTFELYLTENKELFGKEFSVKIIGKDGQEESLPFNTHNFLYGIVLGTSSCLCYSINSFKLALMNFTSRIGL